MQKKIAVLLSLVVLFFLSSRPIFAANIGWMDFSPYLFQDNGCYYPDCINATQNLKFKGTFYCSNNLNDYQKTVNLQDPYYQSLLLVESGDPIPDGSMIKIRVNDSSGEEKFKDTTSIVSGSTGPINLPTLPAGVYRLRVDWKVTPVVQTNFNYTNILDTRIGIKSECSEAEVNLCDGEKPLDSITWKLCNQISDATITKCQICLADKGIWTAVGCIPTDSTLMIQTLIKIGLLIGGGVALLVILVGAFSLSISEGDPKKTSEAKDQITAAIIGLIFIIFSVSILQLIGVQIFHIPEFGLGP